MTEDISYPCEDCATKIKYPNEEFCSHCGRRASWMPRELQPVEDRATSLRSRLKEAWISLGRGDSDGGDGDQKSLRAEIEEFIDKGTETYLGHAEANIQGLEYLVEKCLHA